MISNLKSTTAFQTGQKQTKPFRRFFRKFSHDWSMDFAAMLAYNLLIALLPIAVTMFGVFGLVLKNIPGFEDKLKDKIINSFSSDNTTRSGMEQIVELAFNRLSKDAGFILAIGIILAIFGASRLFIAIDKCMTIIYRLPERTFLRQNILAIGMIFLFLFVIPLMIAVSSAPSALISVIPGGGGRFGAFLLGMIFSLLTSFLLFEVIYWFVPNKKMSFKTTWLGALVAAATMVIFMILFPLYVRRFMGNYAGQIGFAVIFLIFLFYFATILILGAQINAFFLEDYKPLSTGLGTYISQMHEDHGVGRLPRGEKGYDADAQQPFTTSTSTTARDIPQI